MNERHKKQLDRYSMMIVSKYFKTIGDFIKLIRICKKFQEIPEMFHYNPVKLMKKTNLFPNIETYYVYDKKEKVIEGYDKYLYWFLVGFDTYLNKKENEEYKHVLFTQEVWKKYKSFKGTTVVGKNALSVIDQPEMDLSGFIKMEGGSFDGNSIVEHIKLGMKISVIPNTCFYNFCSLKELDLSNIKVFESCCFEGCSSLTALTLPEKIYKIKENTFYGLNDLEKIETKGCFLIESNVNYSLYKKFKQFGIDVKGDIWYNSYDRIKWENKIEEPVTGIHSYCFVNLFDVEDIHLPTTVTILDPFSFECCSIKSIDLSHVVHNFCIFRQCYGITSITLNKNLVSENYVRDYSVAFFNNLTELKNIELYDTDYIPIISLHLADLMKSKGYKFGSVLYTYNDFVKMKGVIPEPVSVIKTNIFDSNNEIQTVIIPSTLTYISYSNFRCMNLESIEIKTNNYFVETDCFKGLPKIKKLDLSGCSSIGQHCICDCPSLTKLVIRNISLEHCLVGCDSLNEIEIIGLEDNIYNYPIDYKAGLLLERKGIHCKTKVLYRLYDKIGESYSIPEGVNEISSLVFTELQIKEIIIPSSVTKINTKAFYKCQKLTNIIVKGTPILEQNAFFQCVSFDDE